MGRRAKTNFSLRIRFLPELESLWLKSMKKADTHRSDLTDNRDENGNLVGGLQARINKCLVGVFSFLTENAVDHFYGAPNRTLLYFSISRTIIVLLRLSDYRTVLVFVFLMRG